MVLQYWSLKIILPGPFRVPILTGCDPSSKSCLLPVVEPEDKCCVEGCQLVLHHMCQTEWESYQYYFECPNGNPRLSQYDSGGKKRCIHHHPNSKLVIQTVMPSTKEVLVENSTSTLLLLQRVQCHIPLSR